MEKEEEKKKNKKRVPSEEPHIEASTELRPATFCVTFPFRAKHKILLSRVSRYPLLSC